DSVVAAHIVLSIMNAPRRIDADSKFTVVAMADMRLPRKFWPIGDLPCRSFGQFAHRFATDNPSIGLKMLVDPFIMSAQDIGRDTLSCRGEAARMKAAIDRGAHMADDIGSHRKRSPG